MRMHTEEMKNTEIIQYWNAKFTILPDGNGRHISMNGAVKLLQEFKGLLISHNLIPRYTGLTFTSNGNSFMLTLEIVNLCCSGKVIKLIRDLIKLHPAFEKVVCEAVEIKRDMI